MDFRKKLNMSEKHIKLAKEIRAGVDGDYDLANYDSAQVTCRFAARRTLRAYLCFNWHVTTVQWRFLNNYPQVNILPFSSSSLSSSALSRARSVLS